MMWWWLLACTSPTTPVQSNGGVALGLFADTPGYDYGPLIDEIAAIMGCKESTVRQHLFRATHKLQDELSDLAKKFGIGNTTEESG